jgi:hypothetical protein
LIPHLVEVWGEYESKGLVVLALSDEASGTVEKHIASKGMTYPTAAGAKGSRAFGVSGIPAGFLLDHNGTIIWQGNPHDPSWEGMLDEALATAEKMSDKWTLEGQPDYMQKAVKLAAKGEIGKMWKETENLLKRFAEEPSKRAEVANLQAAINERAASRTAYSKTFGETGRYQEAADYLTHQVKVFKGSPAAMEWEELMKSWSKDKEIKNLMSLDKKRLKALADAQAGKVDKAKKDLRALNKKTKGTLLEEAVGEAYNLVATMARG